MAPTPARSRPTCVDVRTQLKPLRTECGRPGCRVFPEKEVRQLFTTALVRRLLECNCPTCCSHRRKQRVENPVSHLSTILPDSSRGQDPQAGHVVILALLLWIECPALIYTFVRERCFDKQFKTYIAKFSGDYVKRRFWNIFPNHDVEEYLKDFDSCRYHFAFQNLGKEKDGYEEFPSAAVLPFIHQRPICVVNSNEEVVNGGHFGEVYEFEIVDDHWDFPEFPGVRRFALKVLRPNTPNKRFCEERDNLIMVKKLKDKHLIKMVKSYKHGDMYNFIFPLAKTNLDQVLQGHFLLPYSACQGSEQNHPIWDQLLGVARGLHRVLDCEVPDPALENQWYGYHMDLKTANVLVDENNNLIITDFGQAKFKSVAGTTSNIRGMGGNEAYAPPEIDEDKVENNRKYDVWSLGCILAEVAGFVVKGPSGVRDLSECRRMRDAGTRNSDDRFFRAVKMSATTHLTPNMTVSRSYEVKPQVVEWLHDLTSNIQEGPNKDFVEEIVRLVHRMLNVDVERRLTSKEVCEDLYRIINRHPLNKDEVRDAIPRRPVEGFEVGAKLMSELQDVSYNLKGYWVKNQIHFIQDSDLLHVERFANGEWKRTSLGQWAKLRAIPQYALQNAKSRQSSAAYISLTPNSLSPHSEPRHKKFGANNTPALQEILLGQKTHKSLDINAAHVDLVPEKSFRKMIMHRRGREDEASYSSPEELGDATYVQLWTEDPRQDSIGPNIAMRRQSPRSLRLGPSPVRVVLFCKKAIIILRLAKNERIEQQTEEHPPSKSIAIVRMDKSSDRSFPISILRPQPGEPSPGFALARDQFEADESDGRHECKALTIDFPAVEDAMSFQRTYKKLKKDWSQRCKDFENMKGQIGGQFGYSQSM